MPEPKSLKRILPDGSVVYNFDEANEVFAKVERKKYTVADVILMLLYAQSDKAIHGRIALMKQVFLLINEVLDASDIQDPKFVPNHFGMYSFLVANTLSNLEFANYLSRTGKKNSRLESFRITDKGKSYASNLFQELSSDLQFSVREKRKGWDQLGYEGILRYAYQKYPEFLDKSVLKKRYAPIAWGRGIG